MIKSYASYFVSFLLDNLGNFSNIKKIILFGSAAKGEAKKQSDVDIFIEVKKKNKTFEKEINKIKQDFYKSREALIFKAKKINNKINIIVGKLDEWPDLKKSIESTGIVLYGNYISESKKAGKKYSVFFWDNIKKNRGAFLNKIYGFNLKGKKYPGLLEKINGKKLGKSSIMIPIENREEIIKLFKHYKVNAKVIEVYL
ncbi:MAG: nucleotidyltransferase domain-containing protein [Candidatus Pacearchaeota archaeon]|jgi:predicted nucleotidyltransferase